MNDAPGWLGPASSRGVCHETHAQADPLMQPSVKGHPDQNQAIRICHSRAHRDVGRAARAAGAWPRLWPVEREN
jgi:hypothetical protein